ncbi:flavodoxin [bacterium]|nr:flavodoxin [bacterium]
MVHPDCPKALSDRASRKKDASPTIVKGDNYVSFGFGRIHKTLAGYSVVVLGAPLYMFRWHKDARHFLSRHREALTQRPVAIFALGPFTTGDEKEWQGSREQLNKELAGFPWLTPVALEIFGGKFDPAKLRFPYNLFMRQVPASDLRDWTSIRAWASSLTAKLQPALPQ